MPDNHTELLPLRTLPAPHRILDSQRAHHNRHIAVVGATGYIGSAVLAHLTTLGVRCTAVVRQPNLLANSLAHSTLRIATADLDDPTSLRRALNGADTIIHTASYIGPDPTLCEKTNIVGTQHIVEAAAELGIQNIVYISTVGVYGLGPHTNTAEDTLTPSPVTAASAAKLAAEGAIQCAGGVVIRPAFVHGREPSPFFTGLAAITTNLGSWVDNGSARVSVISVDDLASAVAAVALHHDFPAGRTFHVAHPDPVTIHDLIHLLAHRGMTIAPTTNLTFDDATELATTRGIPARLIDLIGRDHWYDPTRIWSITDLSPTRIQSIRNRPEPTRTANQSTTRD